MKWRQKWENEVNGNDSKNIRKWDRKRRWIEQGMRAMGESKRRKEEEEEEDRREREGCCWCGQKRSKVGGSEE